MADDIVAHLADMATDHGRHCTHYEGCHVYHLECAALMVCAEIERLREEVRKVRLDHITTLGELQEAAAENELLREQVRWASNRASEWKLETYQLNTEIERLQAAGDEMADAATRQQWSRLDVAVAAWQEARRD